MRGRLLLLLLSGVITSDGAFLSVADYLDDKRCGGGTVDNRPPSAWRQEPLPTACKVDKVGGTSQEMRQSTTDATVLEVVVYPSLTCTGPPVSIDKYATPNCIYVPPSEALPAAFSLVWIESSPQRRYPGRWTRDARYSGSETCQGTPVYEEHVPQCYVTAFLSLLVTCNSSTVPGLPTAVGYADCTSIRGPTEASCLSCGGQPQTVLPLNNGCWSLNGSSAQFLECYERISCPFAEWGRSCSCGVGGDCSSTSADLKLGTQGRVPAPDFTIIGNASLSLDTGAGLIMKVTDRVRVQGTLQVSGVLVITNVTGAGTFPLFQLISTEATNPSLSGSFQSVQVIPQNSLCTASGQPVYGPTGLSVLVSLSCGGTGLQWYEYFGIAIGVVALSGVVVVSILLVHRYQTARFTREARHQIDMQNMGEATEYKLYA